MGAAIPIIIAGASAIQQGMQGASEAERRNEATRRAAAGQAAARNRAIAVNQKQIAASKSLEAAKLANRANMVRSRLRVAAGESGMGMGGTYEALMRQTDYEEAVEGEILTRNALAEIASARAEGAKETYMPASPLMEAMAASSRGFSSGLQLGANIQSLTGKDES